MSIITSDDLKAWLTIDDEIDDSNLGTAVDGANSAVENYCRRTFAKTAVGIETARVFRADDPLLVYVDDFWDTTNLVVKTDDNDVGTFSTTWAATDFQLEPLNGRDGVVVTPYYRLRSVANRYFPCTRRVNVQVTAAWGWSSIPDSITQAALIKAAKLFKRKDSPEGVLGGYADVGAVRVSRYEDPDVCALLGPYVRVDRANLIG